MVKLALIAAAAAGMAVAAPAAAQQSSAPQQSSYRLGPLWNMSMIDVEDGQFEAYMDWLSRQWQDNQKFAKQQGWLLDYYILANENSRPGEPDLYLVTRYNDFPSTKEIERRDEIILKRMQMDARTADQQSGQRGTMRKQMGSMLLRELPFRK